MKVACVLIDHFPVQVERRELPDLSKRPLVIGGLPHERKPVHDASPEAIQFGIETGMSLRQAHHLCPDAVFTPLNQTRYVNAFHEVLDILERFSPIVEPESMGKTLLDVSGLEALFGPSEDIAKQVFLEVSSKTGLLPKIGIAASKFVAGIAASLASPGQPVIVDSRRERQFLEPLPIDLLPLSKETKRRLDLVGLRSMGQVASVPKDALIAQFGQEGLLAHELASGIDRRPLVPRAKPTVLEEGLCSDTPVATLDGLMAGIEDLLDRLIPRLKGRNQASRQVRIHLEFDDGGCSVAVITLKGATDSKGEMLGFLSRRLEGARFPSAVSGITIALMGLGSTEAEQGSFMAGEMPERVEWKRNVVRNLKLRFGNNPLKRVIPLDPGSRIPERRDTLIDFEP